MSQYHAFLFVIFGFLLYLIATDDSVAAFVNLAFKLLKFEYEKRKWWLLNNPRNPIVKWMMYRRSMKLAEQMMKELQNETKN